VMKKQNKKGETSATVLDITQTQKSTTTKKNTSKHNKKHINSSRTNLARFVVALGLVALALVGALLFTSTDMNRLQFSRSITSNEQLSAVLAKLRPKREVPVSTSQTRHFRALAPIKPGTYHKNGRVKRSSSSGY
jgi:hypothetical protein